MLKLHCAVRFWVIELVGDGDGEGVKLDGADGLKDVVPFEAVSLLPFPPHMPVWY
jgi:hypothetical protein